jgi:hypothetical protein
MQIFRQGLLEGSTIALAGPFPDAVRSTLSELGAAVAHLDGQAPTAPLDVLLCAARVSADLREGVLLEQEWTVVQAVAAEVFIPARAGRIVLLAPPRAPVVRAALENLARSLSVEWARYGITATAIAPGPETSDEQLATLITYLCSPAGAYFSGTRLDMR